MKIIAATGHRPDKLGGYGDVSAALLTAFAGTMLNKYEGKIAVVSGMALGWDQAIAVAALARDIDLVAAVPFKGQERKWPQEAQRRYREILDRAKKVVYVCEEGYAAYKMHHRNKWMVDRATEILALWNGSAGGTKNCVDYAILKNKSVVNVWGDWQKFCSPP